MTTPGTVLTGSRGAYRLEGRIGEGGSGRVMRAIGSDGSVVAVKMIANSDNAGALARFQREVAILSQIHHPNVLPLVDHGLDNTHGAFLVTPLIAGITLRDLGRNVQLCPEAVLLLLDQLLAGLGVFHQASWIHRDLKPENVMLTPQGELVLLDLGLAMREGQTRLTEHGFLAGSVPYMSPEQIEAQEVSAASDVWAIGIMAYELVVGRRPFYRNRMGEELAAVLTGNFDPIEQVDRRVSDEFSAMIRGCLQTRRDQRSADATYVRSQVLAQFDWTSEASIAAERTALAENPAGYQARIGSWRAQGLKSDALTAIGRSDSFRAMRLLDRALAYAPEDPEALRLVDQAIAGSDIAFPTTIPRGNQVDTTPSIPPTTPHGVDIISGRVQLQNQPDADPFLPPTTVHLVENPSPFEFPSTAPHGTETGSAMQYQSARPYGFSRQNQPTTTTALSKVVTVQPNRAPGSRRPARMAYLMVAAIAIAAVGSTLWLARNRDGGSRPVAMTQPTTHSSSVPVTPVATTPTAPGPGLSHVVELAHGQGHACVRLADGTVWCWGQNRSGRLGDGTETPSSHPRQVRGLPAAATQISLGGWHSCARLSDATVACWGNNDDGQLGDGTTTSRSTPTRVPELRDVADVTAGTWHTCARMMDGTVRCWGANGASQVGTAPTGERCGNDACTKHPGLVGGVSSAEQLAAAEDVTCARMHDATVVCWGDRAWGTDARRDENHYIPAVISNLSNVAEIAIGRTISCARLADGTVQCAGTSAEGAQGLVAVDHIAMGGPRTICVITHNGGAQCWGDNEHGQLGDGSLTNRENPVMVQTIFNASQIAGGQMATCALLDDSSVRCWGSNSDGIVRDGDHDDHPFPLPLAW